MEAGRLTGRERGALWASCGAIVGALLLVAPGRIVPETKLDVLVDPVGVLGRALGAWDPSAGFGRLQNQAVGYLFPMGTFSALGRGLGLPPWLVQRLWLALVVCLSLWGAHRVARAIGVGGPSGRLVAAWAYALAPATVSITFFQSAGQLPYALAPHVLAPLLAPREGEGPRRTAARSALWLVAMGGVNGASTVAVLPLVGLWFLTRSPGPGRRRLAGWWAAGAVAATLWWAIPLLVSIRWGVRFTDFTETAATTTVTESATEVLRGTGNWLSYLETTSGSWLPGSWALAAAPVAIVATVALAAAGLGGLARRDAPERSWLTACLLLGAVAIGAGWSGRGGGPAAHLVQDLLDGPFAPFRNVHKFAAVVRLPLALGVGHLVAVAAARARARGSRPALRLGAPALAAIAVLVALVPMARSGVSAPGSFDGLPASWRQAAGWLEDNDRDGRALILPGSAFGEYRWGRPLDEPLASLAPGEWAVRDLVPLGGNGSTRLLDGIDAALATDALPPGFVVTLERAGVTNLVVRNDLDRSRTGGPGPITMRRLLRAVDGLERVASFGTVIEPADDGRRAPRPGIGGEASEVFRELDVYEVRGATARVDSYPLEGTLVALGGPEGLLGMDRTLLEGRAVVLAGDAEALPAEVDPVLVQTDTGRRRDVQFGAVRDSATATLEAGERSPFSGEEAIDRWPDDERAARSVARLEGADRLDDSRETGGFLTPEAQPFAAFDGNDDTAWVPQRGEAGEWIEVVLDEPVALGSVALSLPRPDGRRIERVRVAARRLDAAGGSAVARTVQVRDGRAVAALDGVRADTIRVTVVAVGGEPDLGTVGITGIEIADAEGDPVEVRRPIVAAPLDGRGGADGGADGGAEVIVLARDRRDRLDQVRRDEDGRFDRVVEWAGGSALLSGTAVAGDATTAGTLLSPDAEPVGPADEERVVVTASTTYRHHPATDATRAVDGDPATAWVSDVELGAPVVTLRWDRPVTIDSLTVVPLASGVDAVGEVVVAGAGVRAGAPQRARLDATGRIDLATPIRTASLELSFPGPTPRVVGIAEIDVPALGGRSTGSLDDADAVVLPCGSGPEVRVDGERIPTEVMTTAGAVRGEGAVPWRACEPVDLAAGGHRIEAARGALFPASLLVAPADGLDGPGAEARSVEVGSWGSAVRTLRVGAGAATVVATTENANEGWEATIDGQALRTVLVDGWRQGWIVPAGEAGTVELRYRPDGVHRGGLVVGGLALLALVGAAVVPGRRRRDPGSVPLAADPQRGRVAVAVGVVGCGVLLAGPVGIAATGALVALVVVDRRRRPAEARWPVPTIVAVGAGCGAGVVALIGAGAGLGSEAGTFSAPAQGLATLALVATGLAVVVTQPVRADSTSIRRDPPMP